MDAAFAWLSELVNWFGKFFPRLKIVRKTHEGIAFVHGYRTKHLLPGLVWWWPLVTEIVVIPVVRQLSHLAPQTLCTKDGRTVVCGGIIIYLVTDIEQYLVNNEDAAEAIAEISLAVVRSVVVTHTFSEIQEKRVDIDAILTMEASRALKDFGVTVVNMRLSDFAPAFALSLISNSWSESATIS